MRHEGGTGMKVIYQGLFMDNQSADLLTLAEFGENLPINQSDKHITFELNPKKHFPEELHDITYKVVVTGYGNNGENAGFEVELPEALLPYYKGADKVHITTSLSPTASAKNTGKLEFEGIEPFYVFARLGYFVGKGVLYQTPKGRVTHEG